MVKRRIDDESGPKKKSKISGIGCTPPSSKATNNGSVQLKSPTVSQPITYELKSSPVPTVSVSSSMLGKKYGSGMKATEKIRLHRLALLAKMDEEKKEEDESPKEDRSEEEMNIDRIDSSVKEVNHFDGVTTKPKKKKKRVKNGSNTNEKSINEEKSDESSIIERSERKNESEISLDELKRVPEKKEKKLKKRKKNAAKRNSLTSTDGDCSVSGSCIEEQELLPIESPRIRKNSDTPLKSPMKKANGSTPRKEGGKDGVEEGRLDSSHDTTTNCLRKTKGRVRTEEEIIKRKTKKEMNKLKKKKIRERSQDSLCNGPVDETVEAVPTVSPSCPTVTPSSPTVTPSSPCRLSPDLLRLVADQLKYSHAIYVFRLICSETRSIADDAMRNVDDVLHLDEFDDENAFTRDDMGTFWDEIDENEYKAEESRMNPCHEQISSYMHVRSLEKNLFTDMDGGLSHPSSPSSSIKSSELIQHPLITLDCACLIHPTSKTIHRLFHKRLSEVWLGHASSELSNQIGRLQNLERFEYRNATSDAMEPLPLLSLSELRIDITDGNMTRLMMSDHLVNCKMLRVLDLNIAPFDDNDLPSLYGVFTRRCYNRNEFTDDLEWMLPNVVEGEPDPVTLCMPELEYLSTNVGNVKIFWHLRDGTQLLRNLKSLRVGTLTKSKELISRIEYFMDMNESRRYRAPGFFSLGDAMETKLESVTLRLTDRCGMSRMNRDVATILESIHELPSSLRRLKLSFFYNQYSGPCAPFKKWLSVADEHVNRTADHIGIQEMHLHFERGFNLRGLHRLLPPSINRLSIAVNYDTEDDAVCLSSLLEVLSHLNAYLPLLNDLHIQVWGIPCLELIVSTLSSSTTLASRLRHLTVSAYPIDEAFFEENGCHARSWIRSTLRSFPSLSCLSLHSTVLARLIPSERRSGYGWRNGLAWLTNDLLSNRKKKMGGERVDHVSIDSAHPLPLLEDGEDYHITPHWEIPYDEKLSLEEEDVVEEGDTSGHFAESDTDDFLTDDDGDGEEEEDGDELQVMDERLEDETDRLERREQRRDQKERAAIERGEKIEDDEDEGELFNFDGLSDLEDDEEERRAKNAFVDDEAIESDGEGSDGENEEDEEEIGGRGRRVESSGSSCSSDDEANELWRDEEDRIEEQRKEKRNVKKIEKNKKEQKKADDDSDEDDMISPVIRRKEIKKRKNVIESSDED